jgi:hypothetical protein
LEKAEFLNPRPRGLRHFGKLVAGRFPYSPSAALVLRMPHLVWTRVRRASPACDYFKIIKSPMLFVHCEPLEKWNLRLPFLTLT